MRHQVPCNKQALGIDKPIHGPWRQSSLAEFGMDDVWIFMPVVNADPQLEPKSVRAPTSHFEDGPHTFLKVLKPPRMLPPIHVVYFRSGGA